MAILGTKKFWKPAPGADEQQKDNQIIKNAGYINIQLRAVNYMSKGNFWQDVFGGKDKVVLATSVKYQNSGSIIEATTVQDIREVKVNANYNFGLQRDLAAKIPANADSLAIEVRMTVVKNDMLQVKFDMLNQTDYQAALQLSPKVIGSVFTVTSLVKKLFSETNPKLVLEASFAGIISLNSESRPVLNGKLTKGMLIMLSTNEGDRFEDVDESRFEFRGDTLYYNEKQVENTYMIINIGFEDFRGAEEKSNWFRKYNEALGNLDRIFNLGLSIRTSDRPQFDTEISRILKASFDLWIEGNALLDADENYINRERINLKNMARMAIIQKFQELNTSKVALQNLVESGDVLKNIVGSLDLETIAGALPKTVNYIQEPLPAETPTDEMITFGLSGNNWDRLNGMLDEDNVYYLSALRAHNIGSGLG